MNYWNGADLERCQKLSLKESTVGLTACEKMELDGLSRRIKVEPMPGAAQEVNELLRELERFSTLNLSELSDVDRRILAREV